MSESDKTIELLANLMVVANEKGNMRQFEAALPTAEGGTLTVGRDRRNNLTIHDDYVSSKHLRIIFKRGKHWLEDLGSTHGTQINNEKVAKITALKPGDAISIGKSYLQYNLTQREKVEQELPESLTRLPDVTGEVTVGPTLDDAPDPPQQAHAADPGPSADNAESADRTDQHTGMVPDTDPAQLPPDPGIGLMNKLMALLVILAAVGLLCYFAWQLFFDSQS